jgi:hypothetical protein
MVAERIHHCPIGRCFFTLASTQSKLAALLSTDVNEPEYCGPFWDCVSKLGIVPGPGAVDAIVARVPTLPAKPRRRLERFLAWAGKRPISTKDRKTTAAIIAAAFPEAEVMTDLLAAAAAQEQASWRWRSLHPSFLALVGEPAEAFCLMPDPVELPVLFELWSAKSPPFTQAIGAALDTAVELAGERKPWLCRWAAGRPTGLWHWSFRGSSWIKPLNGGVMYSRYYWAIFNADGALPSIRMSKSTEVDTPPGMALSHPGYNWSFTERSWSNADDHDVSICHGIDLSNPLRPIGWIQGAT